MKQVESNKWKEVQSEQYIYNKSSLAGMVWAVKERSLAEKVRVLSDFLARKYIG